MEKSAMKKVKDKAKKIKDTIKKHVPGHGHNDDGDDENIINGHGLHVGPTIESTVIKSKELPKETDVNPEKEKDKREDRHGHNVRPPSIAASGPENKNTRPINPHAVDTAEPNHPSKVTNPSGNGGQSSRTGSDKGVSVTEYLAEKFRPGDEDKALSEVITDALIHKKKDEHPLGKVTESWEVAARLGTGKENKREGEDAFVSGAESSGQGMVDRFTDAVGSWLGKSTGMETAQDSVGKSYVGDVGNAPDRVGQGDAVQGQERSPAAD